MSHHVEMSESQSPKSPQLQVIGSLVGLIILVAAGIAIGVTVSKNHHSSASSALSSSNSTGGKSGAVNETNPNDPSSFVKNDALKHSFYGLAYTPEGSQLPDCGNSLGMCLRMWSQYLG